jgi:hypothetical protein
MRTATCASSSHAASRSTASRRRRRGAALHGDEREEHRLDELHHASQREDQSDGATRLLGQFSITEITVDGTADTVTASGLCTETHRLVSGSVAYQTLPAKAGR